MGESSLVSSVRVITPAQRVLVADQSLKAKSCVVGFPDIWSGVKSEFPWPRSPSVCLGQLRHGIFGGNEEADLLVRGPYFQRIEFVGLERWLFEG
jgi:hypothetical protein